MVFFPGIFIGIVHRGGLHIIIVIIITSVRSGTLIMCVLCMSVYTGRSQHIYYNLPILSYKRNLVKYLYDQTQKCAINVRRKWFPHYLP